MKRESMQDKKSRGAKAKGGASPRSAFHAGEGRGAKPSDPAPQRRGMKARRPAAPVVRDAATREFQRERERLNAIVMRYAGTATKRFYHLDWQAYQPGALPVEVKELLGLVASLVLRCDDCIRYHLIRCREEGLSDAELEEASAIALLVGGSITIPHLRRMWDAWDGMKP